MSEVKQMHPLDVYSKWTDSVAQYPLGTEPAYLALGIADEFSEMLDAIIIEQESVEGDNEENIIAEAGDVCWYLARYTKQVLGIPFSEAVEMSKALDSNEMDMSDTITAPGRICGVEKKRLRDGMLWGAEKADDKRKMALDNIVKILAGIREMGRNAFDTQYSIESICELNQAKLTARLAAGTIRGDGDKR